MEKDKEEEQEEQVYHFARLCNLSVCYEINETNASSSTLLLYTSIMIKVKEYAS